MELAYLFSFSLMYRYKLSLIFGLSIDKSYVSISVGAWVIEIKVGVSFNLDFLWKGKDSQLLELYWFMNINGLYGPIDDVQNLIIVFWSSRILLLTYPNLPTKNPRFQLTEKRSCVLGSAVQIWHITCEEKAKTMIWLVDFVL